MIDRTCEECGYESNGQSDRELHQLDEHGDSDADIVQKQCPHCGDKYYVYASNADTRKFCSRDCSLDNRRPNHLREYPNGSIDYGEAWSDARRRAYIRDGESCVSCGATSAQDEQELDVHHVVPAHHFDVPDERNALLNLVTLCRGCHRKWERKPVLEQVRILRQIRLEKTQKEMDHLKQVASALLDEIDASIDD
jgi:5-methylcytosine-specific restriction endonuclease McrA